MSKYFWIRYFWVRIKGWLGLLEEQKDRPVDWDYVEKKMIESVMLSMEGAWISLNTENPEGNASAELSYKGYRRQKISFQAGGPNDRVSDNEVEFPPVRQKYWHLGCNRLIISFIGIHDKEHGGHLLMVTPLTHKKVFDQDDIPRFKKGALNMRFN
jgi:hypothetical protein